MGSGQLEVLILGHELQKFLFGFVFMSLTSVAVDMYFGLSFGAL